MAERVGFEPTARCRVTGFQDRLLKPLGHLSEFARIIYHILSGLSRMIFLEFPQRYVSSVYWQDFFQQKASGTDGVAKARKWRQVQQSSARGFAPAALSCHLEIVAGSPEHVTIYP